MQSSVGLVSFIWLCNLWKNKEKWGDYGTQTKPYVFFFFVNNVWSLIEWIKECEKYGIYFTYAEVEKNHAKIAGYEDLNPSQAHEKKWMIEFVYSPNKKDKDKRIKVGKGPRKMKTEQDRKQKIQIGSK